MKVDYELTGNLEYDKGNPSYEVKKKKSRSGNVDTSGYLKTVKRLPHLMDGFELQRINWKLNGFGVIKRRWNGNHYCAGELIQTKYQIVDTDDFYEK